MRFPDQLGTIACLCVISGQAPVRVVSHAGGDWQMYCHWQNHDFSSANLSQELKVVHIAHLTARDPSLHELADLPVDMAAERAHPGAAWERYEDKDDD